MQDREIINTLIEKLYEIYEISHGLSEYKYLNNIDKMIAILHVTSHTMQELYENKISLIIRKDNDKFPDPPKREV